MRIRVLWEKAATLKTIWIGIVLSSPFWIRMKDKRYRSSIHCIFMKIKMVNLVIQELYFKDEEVELMLTFQAKASVVMVSNITNFFDKNSPFSTYFSGTIFFYSIIN